jgi:hypothetical protein
MHSERASQLAETVLTLKKIGQKMLCTKGPFIYTRSYLASKYRFEAQKKRPRWVFSNTSCSYVILKNPEQTPQYIL